MPIIHNSNAVLNPVGLLAGRNEPEGLRLTMQYVDRFTENILKKLEALDAARKVAKAA
jgi:hypothetical protein